MTGKSCAVCGKKRPSRDWDSLGWSSVRIWKPVKFYGTYCPEHSKDEATIRMIVDKMKPKVKSRDVIKESMKK